MRRLLALGSCLVLVAACSDSDSTASTTSSAAPVTSTSGVAAAAAPLTPEVVCVANNGSGDGEQPDYAFAYTNDSTQPVVLSAADSALVYGEAADLVFVTRVFAPGHVSPAFFVTGDASGQPPSWTVVGPDGQTRTATPDESTPSCDETLDLPAYTVDDPREPIVEISDLLVNADGSVSFTSTLTGADTSVCPAGLDPQPTTITWDDGIGGGITEGATATWTVEKSPGSAPTFTHRTMVAVLVIDGCAYGDDTQTVWPGGIFESLYTGVYVCIADVNGTPTASTSQEGTGCEGLPLTGGSRVRPA